MNLPISRRRLLTGLAAAAVLRAQRPRQLDPWTPGTLDIHHISTGRGSCAFLLCPDGTTVMIDAGSIWPADDVRKFEIDPKPNGSRRPGEWIARYVSRHMKAAGLEPGIDYAILTHFHDDHMGACWPGAPMSKYGPYRTTGLSDVAETVPIRKLIDRGYPDYAYPVPIDNVHQMNYRAFGASLVERGSSVERIRVGSGSQIALVHKPSNYPEFSVRNIAANGEVWTGSGDTTRCQFPELKALKLEDYPTENMCSLAIRLSYGRFDYYSAGDMSCDTRDGVAPWRDIETPAARAAGPVEVAVADHHGYVDASGPEFVRALRPRAFVINAWDSAHPTMGALHNMLNEDLYPGPRDVYATAIKPESVVAIRRLAELKSRDGHVIFRVSPGGGDFRALITSNSDESDQLRAEFGPYQCR